MMTIEKNSLLETVFALRQWLENRIAQDTEFQRILSAIEETLRSAPQPEKNTPIEVSALSDEAVGLIAPPDSVSPDKLAELQLKFTAPATAYPPDIRESLSNYSVTQSPDPERIEQIRRSLTVKAEALCLQSERLENPDAPTEFAKGRLIARANTLGVRLWIFDISPSLCIYPEQIADLSALFWLCADSCILLADLLRDEPDGDQNTPFPECLSLVAEAQSMLKTALERTAFAPEDQDQKRIFNAIRNLADQKQIYIPRHMRTADPAEPSQWRMLQARLNDFAKRMRARREQRHRSKANRQSQQQMLKRAKSQVNYHRKLLIEGSLDVAHDWKRIADVLIQWSESGLNIDDQQLQDLFAPVLSLLPDIRENEHQELIWTYAQSWKADDEEEPEDDETQNLDDPDIRQVANWLRGKSIVFIGGDDRTQAKQKLINAFGLEEVIWISTRPHESLEILKAPIRRDSVVLVVLAIRWASHAYGNINALCRQLDKPLVRLPAGYNPNRMAHEIILQASGYFAPTA